MLFSIFNFLISKNDHYLRENSKHLKSLQLRHYVREHVPFLLEIPHHGNHARDRLNLFLRRHDLLDVAQNDEKLLPLIQQAKMYRSEYGVE